MKLIFPWITLFFARIAPHGKQIPPKAVDEPPLGVEATPPPAIIDEMEKAGYIRHNSTPE
ncbi:MAG: hypothetical protein UY04_C0021G0002 [Parcubacteria group bacterium GW2011_GWA2_47_7]|nr:MAG: hypothetical protein UY04_C0021G0002 [Parcubacteria group bacterium GW2011_GWA2_47_7]